MHSRTWILSLHTTVRPRDFTEASFHPTDVEVVWKLAFWFWVYDSVKQDINLSWQLCVKFPGCRKHIINYTVEDRVNFYERVLKILFLLAHLKDFESRHINAQPSRILHPLVDSHLAQRSSFYWKIGCRVICQQQIKAECMLWRLQNKSYPNLWPAALLKIKQNLLTTEELSAAHILF